MNFKNNLIKEKMVKQKENKENVFPTLYDKDSFGNIKTWDIKAVNFGEYSEIVTLYGRARKIEKRVRITQGKNEGKSNATDHYTQAISEAESKYTKKQGQGYFKLDEKDEDKQDEKEIKEKKGKYKVADFQDPEIESLKLESKINNKLDIMPFFCNFYQNIFSYNCFSLKLSGNGS